jgi:predicted DNA binding CopG/RHH family protein
MTNDAKKSRKNFTLRMKSELSEKIAQEAESLGITQTAYITMLLHKAMKQKIS